MQIMHKVTKPKKKKCRVKGCDNTFEPYNSLQKWCSPEHGLILAKEAQDKARKAEIKAFNRETKARRDKLKSRSDHLRELQKVFNRYKRLKDINEFRKQGKAPECISCGNNNPNTQFCAGHFYTVGARPELRFNEDNVHLQCNHYCNMQLSGNIENYRPRLIEKIGQERFDILSGPHEPKKYTIEEIKELKTYYLNKCKELEGCN